MAIKSDHTGIIQFHGFRYIRKILKKLSLFTPYYGTLYSCIILRFYVILTISKYSRKLFWSGRSKEIIDDS